jgi:hypothetical protein
MPVGQMVFDQKTWHQTILDGSIFPAKGFGKIRADENKRSSLY